MRATEVVRYRTFQGFMVAETEPADRALPDADQSPSPSE